MTAKRWAIVAVVAGLVFLVPRHAAADTYTWTDEAGQKHLTDRLSAVPEKYRDTATHVANPKPSTTEPSTPSAAPKVDERRPSGGPAAASRSSSGAAEAGGDEVFRFGAEPTVRSGAPPPPGGTTGPGGEEVPTDKDGHDQHWWQSQMATALNKQSKHADEVRTLEANKVVLTYGRPAERTQYRQDLDSARKNLETATKAVEDLRKQARSSGADPKWLILPGMEPATGAKPQ